MNHREILLVAITFFAAGIIMGIIYGGTEVQSNYREQAIKLGYAYHEPINGNWQWKTNSSLTLEKK